MRTLSLVAGALALAFNMHLALVPSVQQVSTKSDPHLAAGRLVAKGESRTPKGHNKLLTYRLEEVDLSDPLKFEIRGKTHHLTTILRLTITSESIQGAHTIWIDDAALPRVFGQGAHAIGAFIYDRSILREGAEISVSDSQEFVTLPERLRLPKEFKSTIEPLVEEGNSIVRISSLLRIAGSVRRPMIQIEMRTNRAFPVRNAMLQVQIGKEVFRAGGRGLTAGVFLTPEEFGRIKDGAEVIAFYNSPDRSGASAKDIWYFGRLNKSMLDK
ncbi:MAG: hypothetical protein ACR2LM_02435 [Pyrinomonadaceae bacterium]